MGAHKYYKLISILETPYSNPELFLFVAYMFSCDPCVLSRMNVRTNLNMSPIPILTYRMFSVFWFWDALCLNCCLGWNLSLCVLNSANPFTHGSETTANLNCQLHGNQQTHRWVNNPRRRMCKLEPLLNWDALNIATSQEQKSLGWFKKNNLLLVNAFKKW